jgi:hypothetical protein
VTDRNPVIRPAGDGNASRDDRDRTSSGPDERPQCPDWSRAKVFRWQSGPDNQTAPDSDLTAADSDQTAADSDQVACALDATRGWDLEETLVPSDLRHDATQQRRDTAATRSEAAAGREQRAVKRDRTASERDGIAGLRDERLDAHEGPRSSLGYVERYVGARTGANIRRAAADRLAALRAAAAANRVQAAVDREPADSRANQR